MMPLIRPAPLSRLFRGTSSCIPSQRSRISSLSGKSAIITGASRGIGLAIAQRFSKEGVSCTLVGRNEETLRAAAETLSERDHVNHTCVEGDVSDKDFWEQFGSKHKRNEPYIEADILVNAAGITHYSLLMATPRSRVDEVVQINLMGTIWACQILSRQMIRRKSGCIINVSSLLGVKGGRGSSVYAASKAGIIGLTRSLAAEVGPKNVRVNAILPGYIETAMTEGMDPIARSQAQDAIPLKRFGTAEEIADAAVFLAQNQYANNCVLNIDGGLSAM